MQKTGRDGNYSANPLFSPVTAPWRGVALLNNELSSVALRQHVVNAGVDVCYPVRLMIELICKKT